MLEREFIECVIGQIKGKHHDIPREEIERDINRINNSLEEDHIRPSVELFVKKLEEKYKTD
jgi:hypothetical protein